MTALVLGWVEVRCRESPANDGGERRGLRVECDVSGNFYLIEALGYLNMYLGRYYQSRYPRLCTYYLPPVQSGILQHQASSYRDLLLRELRHW
ncbi:hypothetical protein VTN31DRAFT_643 [Thermomyces dupontii]|uniref:uncharacterized protein n=1 Tax=Talaromyces thermophilus TaxID=28565 RepID=UPI00374475DF